MTESYILFAASSADLGTRDQWRAEGGTTSTVPGLANGASPVAVAQPAYDAFDFLDTPTQLFGGATNATRLLASLDWLSAGDPGFAASFLASALIDSRAFDAPAGAFNPTLAGFPYVFPQPGPFFHDTVLTFLLADRDWNSIKNLELAINNEDLGLGLGIIVRNFVDVRVKLGDTNAHPRSEPFPPAEPTVLLDVQNAKRGSIDATGCDLNVSVILSTCSNGSAWQNSFDLRLSDHDDQVILIAGDHVGPTFQDFHLVNDGSQSLVTTDLGAGNDTFLSSTGRATTITSGGTDTGVLTITIAASPLPGGAPGETNWSSVGGDTLGAGAGPDTFLYAAGDGLDFVLDFDRAQDRLVLDASLRAGAHFLPFGGHGGTLILFGDAPLPSPGSTDYTAAIFVQGVALTETDIVWVG